MNEVILPELGEDIEKATIAKWYFQEGDSIKVDDDVVECVTDKASFHVAADQNGILKNILIPVGQEAHIGDVLAILEPA